MDDRPLGQAGKPHGSHDTSVEGIGFCLIVIGATIIRRRRPDGRITAELAVGLLLVANNLWSPLPAAVITLIGWMAVAEAVAYLFLPDDHRHFAEFT
jgi:hypothetical protein